MNWEVVTAKNGEATLLLNSTAIYSVYNPTASIARWVDAHVNVDAQCYLLIGLGLGYHLQALNKAVHNKTIFVYYFDEAERENYEKYGVKPDRVSNLIQFVSKDIPENSNMQILIPDSWLKAISQSHPLYLFLEDIKIKQVSYEKFKTLLRENFEQNIKLPFNLDYPKYGAVTACLISAGPSLNDTVHWLKEVDREKTKIFCVAAAYKKLLSEGIVPDVVVVSDPQQFVGSYIGDNHAPDLYYLSTVNWEIAKNYQGNEYMLLQSGFEPAEKLALEYEAPTIEVGGSVATVTYSLIELLGFKRVILFGQDLGMYGKFTHADGVATYSRDISTNENLYEVIANSENKIKTTKILMTYLRWFNQKVPKSQLKTYNTAWNGAVICGAPYINKEQFYNIVNEPM